MTKKLYLHTHASNLNTLKERTKNTQRNKETKLRKTKKYYSEHELQWTRVLDVDE